MTELVTLTHPDLPDQPIHVAQQAAAGWAQRGWAITKPKATAKPGTKKKGE